MVTVSVGREDRARLVRPLQELFARAHERLPRINAAPRADKDCWNMHLPAALHCKCRY
jgi:hypothetical protein